MCKSVDAGQNSMSAGQRLKLVDRSCGGVYIEDDRRFVFSSALVGIKSKARFKVTNVKKVCADMSSNHCLRLLKGR